MKVGGNARNRESGYALLFVYAMAASVAIMLYMQLPRVAFEAQREKEQLLIDRGQQYSRAVQLFVRKFNRFPADMNALENTQNIRFLRKQYVDPLTGKNEWRLIHVGPGGVFTDSLVHGPKKTNQNAPQTFITEMQQVGGNASNPTEGVNLASRRRASEQPGAPGDPNSAAQPDGSQVGANGQPGSTSGAAPINGPVMVLPDGRIVPASTSGQYPQSGAPVAGTPNATGQPSVPGTNGFPAGVPAPSGVAVQPGAAGQPNVPGFQNQPNNQFGGAANLINQILTTPRPQPGTSGGDFGANQNPGVGGTTSSLGTAVGGPSGTNNTGTPAGQGMGGTVVGGGIAGVASKIKQEGIKVYNDRTAYNEWEFVYDMSKDPSRGGTSGAGQQQPQQQQPQQQQPQQQQPQQPLYQPPTQIGVGQPNSGAQ